MALHIAQDKHVGELLALCYILVYIAHLHELKSVSYTHLTLPTKRIV